MLTPVHCRTWLLTLALGRQHNSASTAPNAPIICNICRAQVAPSRQRSTLLFHMPSHECLLQRSTSNAAGAQGAWQENGSVSLADVIAEVTMCAAFGSVVLGIASSMSRSDCENLLASSGLLGSVTDIQNEMVSYGRPLDSEAVEAGKQMWLFTSQHHRMSTTEMGIFKDHVIAAEETDEDFFGNFS